MSFVNVVASKLSPKRAVLYVQPVSYTCRHQIERPATRLIPYYIYIHVIFFFWSLSILDQHCSIDVYLSSLNDMRSTGR